MASVAPFYGKQVDRVDEGVAGDAGRAGADAGEESLIILQSLLCLMREKNLLSRADVEELCAKVDRRAQGTSRVTLPCCPQSAASASGLMRRLSGYIGQRYGGKHGRA